MFAGGVDTSATETKGTVLIHTAEQVLFFVFFFWAIEQVLFKEDDSFWISVAFQRIFYVV